MKYPQNYGRPGNSTTYCSDAVMPYITYIDRWTKGCSLLFPKKGDFGLAQNYRGITLTSIAAKIYNALLRNRSEPRIEKILRKNPVQTIMLSYNHIYSFDRNIWHHITIYIH